MSRSDRHRNRRRILLAQSLRAFAYGYTAILIGKALAKGEASGLIVGLTLSAIILGGALTSLLMIPLSKRFSRRELYCSFYLVISLSGVALYFYPKVWALTIVGLLGVLSTDASDNGPATTLEQTMLTERISDEKITGLFSRYNGYAALAAGFGAIVEGQVDSRHLFNSEFQGFLLLIPVGLIGFLLALSLTKAVEVHHETRPRDEITISKTRSSIKELSLLFLVDAAASAITTTSFLTYYLTERYHPGPSSLGNLFFLTSVINAGSLFITPFISARVGIVQTMIGTHLVSNLLLTIALFAGLFPVTVILLIIRSTFSQMDIPTRQTVVVGLVPAEDRVSAIAMTGTSRYLARPAAPIIAGLLQNISLGAPLIAAGLLKVIYGVATWSWAKRHKVMKRAGNL
jgi:predicted MFS family arabinose efflux permease